MTAPQAGPRKYFFSYVREDSEFVLRLAKDLREKGVSLWLDQLDVIGGQRWDHAVESALQRCEGMIAVLSPESIASQNVMDEVSYALEERKLLIPILLRPATMPFRLRRVQYVDFTSNHATGFAQLLRAVDNAEHGRPITDERTPLRDLLKVGGMVESGAAPRATSAGPVVPNASARQKTPVVHRLLAALVGLAAGLVAAIPAATFVDPGGAYAWLGLSGAVAGAICAKDRKRIRSALVGAIAASIGSVLAYQKDQFAETVVAFVGAGALAGALTGTRRSAVVGAAAGYVLLAFTGARALQTIAMLLGAFAGLAYGKWRDLQRKAGA